jgi:hypothetical protein
MTDKIYDQRQDLYEARKANVINHLDLVRKEESAELIRLRAVLSDLLPIAKMAADGTHIPKNHARAMLEKHKLIPQKE